MIYIQTPKREAAFYFALEDLLLKAKGDYLLLWSVPPTIMVGRYQNIYEEMNAKRAREDGVAMIRRHTGGGAIYTNEHSLQYSVITDNDAIDFRCYLEPVVKALKKLGVNVEYNSRNDLAIEQLKISGSAQCVANRRLLHHGSLLYDMDFEEMTRYLTPPDYKMKSKGIKSVRQRVTNIRPHLPHEWTLDEFKHYLESELDVDRVVTLTPEMIHAIEEKMVDYEDIQEHQPAFNVVRRNKFAGGFLEMNADIQKDIIQQIHFSGDIFAGDGVEAFEQGFIGKSLNEVPEYLAQTDIPFYDITKEDIQSLFEL